MVEVGEERVEETRLGEEAEEWRPGWWDWVREPKDWARVVASM